MFKILSRRKFLNVCTILVNGGAFKTKVTRKKLSHENQCNIS